MISLTTFSANLESESITQNTFQQIHTQIIAKRFVTTVTIIWDISDTDILYIGKP